MPEMILVDGEIEELRNVPLAVLERQLALLQNEIGLRKRQEEWMDEPSEAKHANGRTNRQYFDDIFGKEGSTE